MQKQITKEIMCFFAGALLVVLMVILLSLRYTNLDTIVINTLTKENQHLKEQLIKANTYIDLANRIINKPDSVCIWVKTKW